MGVFKNPPNFTTYGDITMPSDPKIRRNVLDYKRDTYLGHKPNLNPEYPPIDCAVGYSQWGVSAAAVRVHEKNVLDVSSYPELFYDKTLKPALRDRFADAEIDASQIFLGHGSFNLAERLIHKFFQPTQMLGVGPQFNEIPSEFVGAGGIYHPIPFGKDDFAFPLEKLIDELLTGQYSTLYIDNPNNPHGSLLAIDNLRVLIQAAWTKGTIVLIDEAYADFVPDSASAAHLVNKFPNVAVIRSFSKCLGLAAYRVGYMFLSKELAQLYKQLDVPFEPVLHGAMMACATLKDKEYLERVRQTVSQSKASVISALMSTGRYELMPTHPSTSILAVRSRDTEGDVVKDMESLGISVEAGEAFRLTCKHWNNRYCRLRVPAVSLLQEFCRRITTLGEVHDVC